MKKDELEQAILRFVRRPKYRPIKPRTIAKRLQVSKDDAVEVKKIIKRLVRRGELTYGSNHLILPGEPGKSRSKSSGNRLVGFFRRNAAGFGFVRPRGAAQSDAKVEDIYIPAKRTGDAATGDLVAIELVPSNNPKQLGPKGHIVEILKRETHQFVGTYFESSGTGCVRVDGNLFARAIEVGDAGAKNARPDDKVVFEMVRFPSPHHDGEGVITKVLGPRGEPGVDTLSVIWEFGLPQEFPEDVLEEARQQATLFDESIPDDRLDLTDLTILTIDPTDARDFDDAISLERIEATGKGVGQGARWRLGVHIADVTHFVRAKSALDREALERGTSVYLPDEVLPMLPETISNSLASLQPDKVRYTKTAFLEFTDEGLRVHTELHSSAIRSSQRLDYAGVDKFLKTSPSRRRSWTPEVRQLLGSMHELAMILRQRRLKHGALELNMPEVKINLDSEGRMAGASAVEHTESHQIIEEFMLAANEAVADWLKDANWHFLRRVHMPPTPRKLKALNEFVAGLELSTESLESRFAIQALLKQVEGRPEERAVHYSILRTMQQAVYGPEEEGHYALASDCYCHFTSPIRRYPDLTVHRLLDAILRGKKPRNDLDELIVLGEHCSDRERRAEAAERALTKLKLLAYFSKRIGEKMEVVVTGVQNFGLFVQGIEIPVEGLIHIDSLADDRYQFDQETHTLSGFRSGNCFRLGDTLLASVARVNLDRRELDFRLVERKSPARQIKPSRAPKKAPSKTTKKKSLQAPKTRRVVKKKRKTSTRRKRSK